MCATCGCGDDGSVQVTVIGSDGAELAAHDHAHAHGLPHDHHDHPLEDDHPAHKIDLEAAVLAKNDKLAERNRGWLAGRGTVAINLMSSPGSGKTTLLERTIAEAAGDLDISVIEGDQATTFDAQRIRATGAPVVQVNTGAGCHLDADMVSRGLTALDPAAGSVVVIENVGNLVCPALFDLGESSRVVVMSVTEGSDKPLKYPHMFRAADLVVLNKIDLLPYVDFDEEAFAAAAVGLRPRLGIIKCSAKTGAGLEDWMSWLRDAVRVTSDASL